jgi:hypothetical protein
MPKPAHLRRMAAREEPLVFGSLYKLPSTDSKPMISSSATSGTALARARSFMHSIRGWFSAPNNTD